ncbi:MAG: Crp/Fnr family transcriptional regulator [Fimbriimonadaceae bacterium]|nr:Crp/Fnr family transcriptional regulator [Alphaproteobacteria bacterium]
MLCLKDEVELLRQIPLFANIDPARLKLLAFTSQRMSFKKDQELFSQGDMGDAAYVILKGTADVLISNQDDQALVATIEKNEFVGEIAILCDVPRTATVRASGELETLKIMKDQFLDLLSEFPEMSVAVMRELANRLSDTTAELSKVRGR